MAEKILIIGDTGSGKSTSTKTLNPDTTFYINVIGKPLPFRGWKGKYKDFNQEKQEGNMWKTHDSVTIIQAMNYVNNSRPEIETIIVDDAQYIMSFEYMERAKETGWDKFTEIAQHMLNVLRAPDLLRDDLKVIFLTHSEDISVNGRTKTKMKTIGKVLDDKITIEGLFTIVLMAESCKLENGTISYGFRIHTDGTNCIKSPDGMFEGEGIPNDLKFVIDKVDAYNNGE